MHGFTGVGGQLNVQFPIGQQIVSVVQRSHGPKTVQKFPTVPPHAGPPKVICCAAGATPRAKAAWATKPGWPGNWPGKQATLQPPIVTLGPHAGAGEATQSCATVR